MLVIVNSLVSNKAAIQMMAHDLHRRDSLVGGFSAGEVGFIECGLTRMKAFLLLRN